MSVRLIYGIPAAALFLLLPLTGVSSQTIGLQEAENLAIDNNFELKSLRMELRINNEAMKGKYRDFFPSVSFSYRHGRSIAERNLDNSNYSVQMSVTQPVYDSGRRELAYEISQITTRMSMEKYKTVRAQLQFKVRGAYLEIQKKRDFLSLSEKSLENSKLLLEKAEVEHRQGVITEIDYREIKNENEKRVLDLTKTEDDLRDAYNDFYFLLNIHDQFHPELRHLKLYNIEPTVPSVSVGDLIDVALKSRTDYREAQLAVDRETKEYLISKYSSLPQISITGSYGRSGEVWPPTNHEWGLGVNFSFDFLGNSVSSDTTYNSSQNNQSKGYSTGGSLNLYDNPLWKQDRLQKALNLKKGQRGKKELNYQIESTIQRLYRDILQSQKNLKLADEITAIQERRHEIERRKFSLGEISLHDYFREELRLNENRLKLIQERVDYVLSINKLELEMGLDIDSLKFFDMNTLMDDAKMDGSLPGWASKTVIKPSN
jgi:outer membrane protein TolC